jgi:hypothetical protein
MVKKTKAELEKEIRDSTHTVVQDETHPHMYRVRYPDGELSKEMYNRQRAVEHIRILNQRKEDEDIKS